MNLWRGFIEDQAGERLDHVKEMLTDQRDFAKFARSVIARYGLWRSVGR